MAELRKEKDGYISADQAPKAFERFTEELFTRLQRDDDAKEAAAFAAFGMFRNGFFEDDNRLLSHALADLDIR